MRWPLTFFTDALPEGRAGVTQGPVIRIRPRYRNDEGLYRHEYAHVKQFFVMWAVLMAVNVPLAWLAAGWWLPFASAAAVEPWTVAVTVVAWCSAGHPLLYLYSRRYRQYAEAAAYREQTRWPDGQGGQLSLDDAAARLALPLYNLGITAEQAKAALLEG